jgi:hypothetical protein
MFDMATLSGNAVGFHGAGFDGQYVYFSPSNSVTGGATPMNIQLGVVARFSAKSPSWLPLGWHAAFD